MSLTVGILAYGRGAPMSAPDSSGELCGNCDDGCFITTRCDGCDTDLCGACWLEHEVDAPCHVDDPEAWSEWLAGALGGGG